ncbi:unnamed protein product [Dibothriocephalus latus]|uniref:Uncharacterized protein n=1 Tax=Dibothriocephalus latus TaxID=60516 RepID=A0A3P6U7R8_DIBLA|nr:unnamed protein product [Dibothriocephalus latus]
MQPFTSNRDMKILRVLVPPHTLSFNLEISVKKANECDNLGLEINLQPKSLPIVRPFQVPLPPHTFASVESTNFVVSLELRGRNSSQYLSSIHKIDLPVYVREAGEWFIAMYASGTLNTDSSCRLWLFTKAIFDVLELDGHLSATDVASVSADLPSVNLRRLDFLDQINNNTRLPAANTLPLLASSEKIYS